MRDFCALRAFFGGSVWELLSLVWGHGKRSTPEGVETYKPLFGRSLSFIKKIARDIMMTTIDTCLGTVLVCRVPHSFDDVQTGWEKKHTAVRRFPNQI
jgi:hypothetical protein